MEIIKLISGIQKHVIDNKHQGKRIGLVPTLGFLHKGHQSLMKKAREENDIVIISIFVNPLQFKRKQFEEYPRDLKRDEKIANEMDVDIIFAPGIEEMYPSTRPIEELFKFQVKDFQERLSNSFFIETPDNPDLPAIIRVPANLCNKMDGKIFPWHFDGVATIVSRLFKIIEPDKAYFGEKDVQQLAIIQRIVKDFHFDLKIISVPTAREPDGLACSSRNSLLSPQQRRAALILHTALKKGKAMIQNGESNAKKIVKEMTKIIQSEPLVSIDYIDIIKQETLETAKSISVNIILYATAYLDGVRLTDNLVIG